MKTLCVQQLSGKQTRLLSLCCAVLCFCMITQLSGQRFMEITTNANGVMHLNLGPNNSNTIMGREAGINLATTNNNSLFGSSAGGLLTSGSLNTFIGTNAGSNITSGSANVYVGYQTGQDNAGTQNTFIGTQAGASSSGDLNVFIGHEAGENEQGSNQLYIANDERTNALIRGDFALEEVTINGDLFVEDILQIKPTTADPGCTVDTEIGKLWMSPAGAGRMLRVCRGTLGWQDLF